MKPCIITIDGPSGAGKGTVCVTLARCLSWPLLDSGAIYRVLALGAMKHGIENDNIDSLLNYAADLDILFPLRPESDLVGVILEGQDVSAEIRTEQCGNMASKIAVIPPLRKVLLARQRAFATAPGLVADGRDMGSVVFPAANLKIYLIASAEVRAERRYKQLKEKGIDANLANLRKDINERDTRDSQRSVSPLKPAKGAIVIDTSELSIADVIMQIKHLCCMHLQLLCENVD